MHSSKFAALLLLGVSLTAGMAQPLSPGSRAPDFTLEDYQGKVHKLSDYQGNKAVVIIFLSANCPVVDAYSARMAQLHKAYAAREIVFLGINSNRNETVEQIREHAREQGVSFSILKDEGNGVADQFGATVAPEVFVLNNKLTVLYHGRLDDSQREAHVKRRDLQRTLDEILSGKTITDQNTRPFGCSIKRAR